VSYIVYPGDCLEVMKRLDDESVDAIVTDPPYGLGFMGKEWDSEVPAADYWAEALRVAKPGAHLVGFSGSRTYHRAACAVEDAGWEVRDQLIWLYGQGFPKSHDVSKAIDAAAGAEREERVTKTFVRKETSTWRAEGKSGMFKREVNTLTESDPVTDEARAWEGWGTALKPAHEPAVLARKPLDAGAGGTVAGNVLAHGCGALNIDAGRVEEDGHDPRWPANVAHDGSEQVADILADKARYFYCAKAGKKDRDLPGGGVNNHPTVKPLDLMRWLVRLVCRPDGVVLDPFTGSGSTGVAALMEGCTFIGIERDEEYASIANQRLQEASP
jgi:hypothetical protein